MDEPEAAAGASEGSLDLHAELEALVGASPDWLADVGTSVARAFDAGGSPWPLVLLAALGVGIAGERLGCWKLDALNRLIARQSSDRWVVNLGYALFRVAFDLAGVLLFGLFAWIVLYAMLDKGLPIYATLNGALGAVVIFRCWVVVVRAILAPRAAGIRPLALSCDDAAALYRWTVLIIGTYVLNVFLIEWVVVPGMTPVLGRATTPVLGLTLVALIVVFVWRNRERLARLFAGARDERDPPVLTQILAQSWPYMVTAWFMLLWGNWAYAIFTANERRLDAAMVSWWITLLFPLGDRLVNALLRKIASIEWLRETGFERRRERFVAIVQTCVRATLVAVAVAGLAVTWDIAGTSVVGSEWGQGVIWAAVDIGVTVLFAYILYEVVMSVLDKHMPEEDGEEGEVGESEVGGAGASRQETLAPLLRGVFVVLLALTVALTVLNSLGVQILPLIAGASIIGLAIGFGSQKLVQDVISGVFFLVDDAFRRGEYIDVGSVKGTVERISVRSMQLRHHMGALHTIPFGEIRHLTNFSRDWVMMKLKLRLTYDTDVEKVRKLVKRLGNELLEDEELGPLFLQPLKSQGVYSMEDDSAMIVRVKFMTRPGDQFLVRKAVYARIRDTFAREGVEFAHRVVSVRLDGASPDDLDDEQKRQVAGAALAARNQTP